MLLLCAVLISTHNSETTAHACNWWNWRLLECACSGLEYFYKDTQANYWDHFSLQSGPCNPGVHTLNINRSVEWDWVRKSSKFLCPLLKVEFKWIHQNSDISDHCVMAGHLRCYLTLILYLRCIKILNRTDCLCYMIIILFLNRSLISYINFFLLDKSLMLCMLIVVL